MFKNGIFIFCQPVNKIIMINDNNILYYSSVCVCVCVCFERLSFSMPVIILNMNYK